MAYWADHQQETERVANEPRHADEYSASEDDQSVEELSRRYLASGESFLGVDEYSETDAAHHEWSERADSYQNCQSPEEADLVRDRDKRGDFGTDDDQNAEKEHTSGYRRIKHERPR